VPLVGKGVAGGVPKQCGWAEARNAISHVAIGLQDDEELRYLDATHRLMMLTEASEQEIAEVKRSTSLRRAAQSGCGQCARSRAHTRSLWRPGESLRRRTWEDGRLAGAICRLAL
jgi:hypothetical protein